MLRWLLTLWFWEPEPIIHSARRAVISPRELSAYEIGSSVVRHSWERKRYGAKR